MSTDQDRTEELAAAWTDQLRRTGQVQISYDTETERDLYRRAGRKAGRLLERPITTHVHDRQVFIVLDDWMDNPLQAQVEDIRTRKAIDRAFAAPATSTPQPPQIPATRLRAVPPPDHDPSN